jgi:vacuolar-type H+-ATPase subunit I/STV1
VASIVTFPFMFAVMFGDIGFLVLMFELILGHGFILFFIALLICIYERRLALVKFDVCLHIALLILAVHDDICRQIHCPDDGRILDIHGSNI